MSLGLIEAGSGISEGDAILEFSEAMTPSLIGASRYSRLDLVHPRSRAISLGLFDPTARPC